MPKLYIDLTEDEQWWNGNEARLYIEPSANASIQLLGIDGNYENICQGTFTGKTEHDVKAQVESWAALQYQRIADVLRDNLAKENTK
ncbi:MAG: hypothetical protein Q7U76_12715 [Nitrospirota bacterium]|nr:hypothetical protein [Nitrospirota bacterium]